MLRSELKAIGDVIVNVVRAQVRNAADVLALRLELLEKRQAEMPAGRDGRDGAPGVKGEPGANGRDGADGLGFDDLAIEYDGVRTYTFNWRSGERVKTLVSRAPFILDQGVFRAMHPYEKGDAVSYGGSLWIAQKDDPAGKPGEVEGEWRLAVKKGRDGGGRPQ